MANEIEAIATTGATLYALIYDASGNVWQTSTSTFVAYLPANQANYAVAMTEGVSGYFTGSFPTAVTVAGTYSVEARQRATGTPLATDITVGEGSIVWDGSAEVVPSTDDLIDLPFLKSYLGITTTTDDSLLRSLISAASSAVVGYCRRPFKPTSYTEDCRGTDDWTLQLRYVPVTALTQVVYDAYNVNPTTVTGSSFILDSKTGQITLKPSSTASGWFFSGPAVRHQISYTAGYSLIPADVQQVTAIIAQGLYLQRGTQLLTTQEQIGDYHAWYTLAAKFVTGKGEVTEVLDRYRDWTTA